MNLELIPRAASRDVSGFAVFSHGDAGGAHLTAHRLLDAERYELGERILGAWLARHVGRGSDWTHLQWHMAVFELAVGSWDAALERFEAEILPVAASSDDALTDAPALLWRLELSAPTPVHFDWEPIRRAALRSFSKPCGAYVELHGLLALAGAHDIDALDRWIRLRRHSADLQSKILAQMGIGLRAYAAADYELAASVLRAAAPKVSALGGSHAQNQLFEQIAALSWEQARFTTTKAA